MSDNTFPKLLKCKPCVGAKLVLRFRALITRTFLDRSILFCRINMSETDFIYLKIWYDSVTFCHREFCFTHPVYAQRVS